MRKEWSSNEKAENGKSLWLLIVVPPLELKIKYLPERVSNV